ncbi:MAG: 50S ribosomal protein L30 [Clostridia bacterium]|jgi:large subunit ribosomal protein L30|nr:50S ribosomal protein L30 [Clostridia bacterium]MBO7360206.1 50S ribosomal protein L30 [Clostridia bacterium]MBP5271113.1 50S ribosomal protein L30 [Clostridia bacterium]MCR4682685.1 50S ribosomal protein L30 [Clostridiales bacterium]
MKKVTLIRSLITCKPNQKATADSLGLRKIGDSVIHAEGPVLNGKIKILSHLVKVEDCDGNGKENA